MRFPPRLTRVGGRGARHKSQRNLSPFLENIHLTQATALIVSKSANQVPQQRGARQQKKQAKQKKGTGRRDRKGASSKRKHWLLGCATECNPNAYIDKVGIPAVG